jgi:hypothetical protein
MTPPSLPVKVRLVEARLRNLGLTLMNSETTHRMEQKMLPEPEAITTPLRPGPMYRVWMMKRHWASPLMRESLEPISPEELWTATLNLEVTPTLIRPRLTKFSAKVWTSEMIATLDLDPMMTLLSQLILEQTRD